MNSKEYVMPDGKKAVFEYDHNGIGKVTIEAMDMLMGLIADGRKRGEWVISYTDDYGIKKTECSACGTSFITYDVYGWKYCPWCGASMREREGE